MVGLFYSKRLWPGRCIALNVRDSYVPGHKGSAGNAREPGEEGAMRAEIVLMVVVLLLAAVGYF